MSVVSCAKTSLPRSLDVPISLSRSVAETATDMTMLCFVTPNVDFPADNNRVQFFSTFDAVQEAVPENSEAIFAAQAFFNRTDRPQTMCIGAVFSEPTKGVLTGSSVDFSKLANITNGGFNIVIGDTEKAVSELAFDSTPTAAEVVAALNSALSSLATATVKDDAVTLSTIATGDGADIGFATSPEAVVNLNTLLHATEDTGATLAEGETAAPAKLTTGTITPAELASVKNGALAFTVNGVQQVAYGLDFTSYGDGITVENIVSVLSVAFSSKLAITASYNTIVFATTENGEDKTMSYGLVAPAIVDVSSLLGLTQETYASKANGYTPGGLVSEAALIQTAARCSGRSIFAWTLDRQYRDTADQKAFADWIEAQDQAYFSACTNSTLAYNTADSTNIGFYANNKGYIKTSVFYHNNPQVYPDVSYAALALSVNYALENSTITMKFKQLTGIETVPLTETQLSALASRRINSYVSMGNSSSVIREGVQSADSWFTDSHVNLSNYKEELQVEVFNVFMRNKKVPYTSAGQDLLVSAATKINNRYVKNGTFADREEETTDNETGYTTLPATTIIPSPVYSATTSERANRIAPPISIVAYEAGAFHSVSIDVTVYN